MANLVYISIGHGMQHRLQGILAARRNWRHVRWFAIVPLFPQVSPETMEDIVLLPFKELGQALSPHITQERHKVLESLVRLVNNKIQVEERHR